MKAIKRVSIMALCLCLSPFSAVAAKEVCEVTDPTGTPLNIRATPNGRIVGTAMNGTEVEIENLAHDGKGRPWALISLSSTGKKRVLGWVIREFISCYRR